MMEGEIVGENEDGVGVDVIDNNGTTHEISVEKSSCEIVYHNQDGYADDPTKRTKTENEHVKQARRYARYYVLRERGYPTLEPAEIPEWNLVVAAAIASLSSEEFERHFGSYHQQLRAVVAGDVEPVIDVPEDDVAGLRVYLLSVHLGIDLADHLTLEESIAVRTLLERERDPEALLEVVTAELEGLDLGPDALSIAGVSDVGVLYQGSTREIEQEGADPNPGPADARLELSPTAVPDGDYLSLEEFRVLVVHHLLCQARDCYLQMGLEPPVALRVLGLGTYRQTVRNEHLELYPPVHATTEPVEGYTLPELSTHLESNPS